MVSVQAFCDWKMPMLKKIFILCSCLFLLVGCTKDIITSQEISSAQDVPQVVFTETVLPLPEDIGGRPVISEYMDIEDLFDFQVTDEAIIAFYYTTEKTLSTVTYDWSGTLLYTTPVESILLPEPKKEIFRYSMTLPQNENLVMVNTKQDPDSIHITGTSPYRLNADEEVLYTYVFPDVISGSVRFAIANDGQIAVLCGDTIYIFSDSLILLHTYQLVLSPSIQTANTILWENTEELLYSGFDGVVYRLHCNSGKCTPLYTVDADSYFQTFPSNNDHFSIWKVDEDGVWGVSDAMEEVWLASWDVSSIAYADLTVHAIRDENTLLCTSRNTMDSTPVCVLLCAKDTVQEVPSSSSVSIFAFQDQNTALLQKLVQLFNKENNGYTVELQVYDIAMLPANMETISTKLHAWIDSGTIPDILLLNSYGESLYRNLENEGYLSDLSAWTDRLTASAQKAVSYRGKYTRLPFVIRYNTLLSTADENITVDTLFRLADTLEPEMALFSEDIQTALLASVSSRFVDVENAVCSFDDPDFIQYLSVFSSLSKWTDTSLGTMQVFSVDGGLSFRFTNENFPVNVAQGAVHFTSLPLWSPECWAVVKLCYPEENMYIAGYPDIRAITTVDMSFVQFQDGKCSDGASVFFDYILQDTIQTSATVTSYAFPVTRTALQSVLTPQYILTSSHSIPASIREQYPQTVLYIEGSTSDATAKDPLGMKYIAFAEEDCDILWELLDDDTVSSAQDPIIAMILTEEISVYLTGDRNAEDTAHILQSRISTYLAE